MKVQIVEINLKFKSELAKRNRTDYIVLHHADISKATVEGIHQIHLNKGWAGIGYHFYVRKDGNVYRGRPRDAIGAHCLNYNDRSIGICAEGNYENEQQMPNEQKNAIIALLVELKKIYPPAKIVGHRDLNATACPGKYYPFKEILAAMDTNLIFKKEVVALFKDVPNNHWAKGSIERMAQLGLLKGDNEGNFKPDDPLTRAQLAAVLDRLLNFWGVKQ